MVITLIMMVLMPLEDFIKKLPEFMCHRKIMMKMGIKTIMMNFVLPILRMKTKMAQKNKKKTKLTNTIFQKMKLTKELDKNIVFLF
jgi:hypothetical protein